MTGSLLKSILDTYNAAAQTSGTKNHDSPDAADTGGTACVNTSAHTCVCIHGAPQTGKSALIGQVKNMLLMNGANVYFYVDEGGRDAGAKKASSQSPAKIQPSAMHPVTGRHDFAVRELLRQLARMYGSRHDHGFTGFISSYAKGTLADDVEKQVVKPLNKDSIIKFTFDCVRSEPAVFVIDDLDMADAFTVRLIGNLLETGALPFLVISHTDKLENDMLSDFLFRNTKKIKYYRLQDNADAASDSGNVGISDAQGRKLSAVAADLRNELDIVFDEAMMVLSQPGRERQLIRHYMKSAEHFAKQLSYERAALILSAALDVCRGLDDSPDNLRLEIELLISLADAQALDKQLSEAAHSYNLAFQATDIQASSQLLLKHSSAKSYHELNQKAPSLDFTDKRIEISVKLSECYKKLDMQNKSREHIMLSEAYLCTSESRMRYYDLYSQHIPMYLDFLAELGERAIFREKLKQAYIVCRMDDKELTGRLYCEEGHMFIENSDFEKAHELLLEARKLSEESGCDELWDESTNSLAICSEHMGQPDVSDGLWEELINKSRDPVKAAWAMVNRAIMNYERSGDAATAVDAIRPALDLCVLAGDRRTVLEIRDNLRDTPLAV